MLLLTLAVCLERFFWVENYFWQWPLQRYIPRPWKLSMCLFSWVFLLNVNASVGRL
jgi:hypothetical protein